MTEREKMLAGEPYDARDPELTQLRLDIRDFADRFNSTNDEELRMSWLPDVLGAFGPGSFLERPVFFDYGSNLYIGRDSFVNTGSVFLDCAPITIGDRVQIASNVQLLAADHPREIELRAQKVELAKPVTIGDDVWIGAGAIVCPGVSIGAGSIIGAGSVVVKDIPAGVTAVGNPCRVIGEL